MPVKIRLARHGRKRKAFYHIVVADSRAPRDGRFIEKIGSYNPNTNPATIVLDNEKALSWLKNGAQPSDTARAILSYKGVLLKQHLEKGVQKGALTAEQAQEKYQAWVKQKESKIEAKKDSLKVSSTVADKKRLEVETEVNKKRAAELNKKNAPAVENNSKHHETQLSAADKIDAAINAGNE